MTLLRMGVVFAGLAFAFRYRGPGEPFVWAIAVTLAIIVALPSALSRSDFAPHWVRLWPTRALLTETGLATEETVKRLEEELAAKESEAYYGWNPFHGYNRRGEHSFLRDGIWFTVLKPDNFDQSGLVYWNEFKVFSTSTDRTLDLEELAQPCPYPALSHDTMAPHLCLEPVRDGLSLRIATAEEILDHTEGGREIALIPWAEFRGRSRNAKKMKKLRDAQLMAHGWKRDDEDEDLWLGAPSKLRHRFFTVEWDYI